MPAASASFLGATVFTRREHLLLILAPQSSITPACNSNSTKVAQAGPTRWNVICINWARSGKRNTRLSLETQSLLSNPKP